MNKDILSSQENLRLRLRLRGHMMLRRAGETINCTLDTPEKNIQETHQEKMKESHSQSL